MKIWRITTKMRIIFQSKYFAENMAFLRIQIAIFFLFWIHFNAKGVKTREFITCIKKELWLNIATVCISHISNPTIHNHNLQSFCHYVTVVFSYRSLQMLFYYDCVWFFFSFCSVLPCMCIVLMLYCKLFRARKWSGWRVPFFFDI